MRFIQRELRNLNRYCGSTYLQMPSSDKGRWWYLDVRTHQLRVMTAALLNQMGNRCPQPIQYSPTARW